LPLLDFILKGGLPATIKAGLGMTGLYAPPGIEQADRALAEQMMQAVGKTLWVEQESGINGVIAAAGSAPAYFFLFMQAIAEEAEAMGFSPEQADSLVAVWQERQQLESFVEFFDQFVLEDSTAMATAIAADMASSKARVRVMR
jgi:hypothetical protein